MPAEPIYLDHNATTPIFPAVVEAMRACWAEPYLNPASQHEFGRRARRVLEEARDRIGELLGAALTDRVIFTSGGTESNNLAILGILHSPQANSSPAALHPHLVISSLEHPSISTLSDAIEGGDTHISRLGANASGILRVDLLAQMLRPATRLAASMLANNETGVIQPVVELATICNRHNIPLHVDAAQAAGKLAINFQDFGASSLSIAAHKFGGPVGIGALVVREGLRFHPQLFGGFQQDGTRPGTESVALAVGMRTALDLWDKHRSEWSDRIAHLRDKFETALCRKGALTTCQPIVIGKGSPRLPTTSNIAFVGLDRQELFIALDQAGVACSTGSACASGSSEPSPVHIAMGLEPAVISSALRFSLGVSTTREEIDEAARRIIKVCNQLRR